MASEWLTAVTMPLARETRPKVANFMMELVGG